LEELTAHAEQNLNRDLEVRSPTDERQNMNHQFDELTKGLAQSVTRCVALKKFGVGLTGMALACFGLAVQINAGPAFTTLDFPGAVFTAADDINATGQIVGWYVDASGKTHGFFLDDGNYTSIDFPGAAFTSLYGINADGDMVGRYALKEVGADKDARGFLLQNGVFTSIDFPGAAETRPLGISSAGDIVGIYADQKQGKDHGFILRGGTYYPMDYPGSAYTGVWKLNDSGQIVGRYQTSGNEKFHLFLWRDGNFVSLPDYAGAAQMAPTSVCGHHSGMNGAGDIVTAYADSTPVQNNGGFNQNMLDNLHGLLWSGGVYTTIDCPGARGTVAYGINDYGVIVGVYQDPSGRFHGYVRIP
jgi:probable HAF family extracellular repeat protein